ncbi:MAG: hypothetical protein NDJ89_12605 [Oligoflexia bacterium]|nr:hypothetical protein [Oligoflexia bacterium]
MKNVKQAINARNLGLVLGATLVAAGCSASKSGLKADRAAGPADAPVRTHDPVAMKPSYFEQARAAGVIRTREGFGMNIPTREAPARRRGRSPASVDATDTSTPRTPRGGTPLQPNSIRYREKGAKPGTGRAGSATISTRALLGKDGTSVLELTTGVLDSPTTAVGNISRVQLKLVNASGATLSARNFNSLASGGYLKFNFTDFARGQPLRIQADVTGIDGARTSVVSVQDKVYLRPDLKVSQLGLPAKSFVDAPVNISATVSELNSDLGAQANCVLYVDGAEADRASGIWVDAGGTVSCVFTKVFNATGTKQVQVKVEDVVPGDYDVANNSVSGSLEIVSAATPMASFGLVEDFSFTNHQKSEGFVLTGIGGVDSNFAFSRLIDESGWRQNALISASSNTASIGFPVSVSVVEKSDGTQVNSFVNAALPADFTFDFVSGSNRIVGGCSQVIQSGTGGMFTLCTQKVSATTSGAIQSQFVAVDFFRLAGDVTYRATGFEHFWSQYNGIDNFYVINEDTRFTAGTRAQLGSRYSFDVRVSAGIMDLAANSVVPLSPFTETINIPYGCTELVGDSFSLKECFERNYSATGKRGTAFSP